MLHGPSEPPEKKILKGAQMGKGEMTGGKKKKEGGFITLCTRK